MKIIKESSNIFYVGKTEVIQNPSDSEYRQLYQEIRKRLGSSYDYKTHEPLIRHTFDDRGNEYIWNALDSTHYYIENEIKRKFNVKVNQNKNFDLDENLNLDIEKILLDNFISTKDPIGRAYISPTGFFISCTSNTLFNEKPNIDFNSVPHGEILRWLSKNGYIKDDDYEELEKLGFIRVSDRDKGIILNKIKPTNEQYDALLEWIKFINLYENIETIWVNSPTNVTAEYILDEDSNYNYIINRIKLFYDSGNLYENLDTYKIYYRWDNHERAYEIWVEDSREIDYPEIYHSWVGDKVSLNYEINELEKQYKVKAKQYK